MPAENAKLSVCISIVLGWDRECGTVKPRREEWMRINWVLCTTPALSSHGNMRT